MQCIHLNRHTVEIQAAQQLLEGYALAGFTCVVGLLSESDAERTGLHRELGDKAVGALLRLDRGAAQRFAVTDQLVQTLCTAGIYQRSCRARLLRLSM